MNRERLELIASLLSDVDEESRTFVHEGTTYILRMNVGHKKDQCGTVCCIAGLAASLFDPEFISTRYTYPEWYDLSETARVALGLSLLQSKALFLESSTQAIEITPSQAAEGINRLLDGKYPWLPSDHAYAAIEKDEFMAAYPRFYEAFPNEPRRK